MAQMGSLGQIALNYEPLYLIIHSNDIYEMLSFIIGCNR